MCPPPKDREPNGLPDPEGVEPVRRDTYDFAALRGLATVFPAIKAGEGSPLGSTTSLDPNHCAPTLQRNLKFQCAILESRPHSLRLLHAGKQRLAMHSMHKAG